MATRTFARHRAGTPDGGRFLTTTRPEPETVLGLPVEEVNEQIQKSVLYWGGRRGVLPEFRRAIAQEVWVAAVAANARKTFDGENPCGYIHALARNATVQGRFVDGQWDRGLTRSELAVAAHMETLAAKNPPSTPAGWDELYDQAVAEFRGMRSKALVREAVIEKVRAALPGGVSTNPRKLPSGSARIASGETTPGGTSGVVQATSDEYFQHELPGEAPKGEVWNHLAPDVRPIKPKSVATRAAGEHRKAVQAAGGPLSIARRLLDAPVDRDTEAAFCAPWGRLSRSEQIDVADALVRNPHLANRLWAVALRASESRTP